MKIKSLKNIFILFLLAALTAGAQEASKIVSPMTLEQCIDYALKNNIQIKQSILNTELSQLSLTQSEANLLPELNANGSHAYNFGRTIDRFTNEFATQEVLSQNFSLNSDITLFSGWQNVNAIKQNRYNYLANKYNVDKIKNDISLNIASAYLQILFALETVENARNQMGITDGQVQRTKLLVDAGAAAKGTLLDIQAQLASEELNLTTSQNQLDISYLSLAQLLNLEKPDDFRIVKPDLAIANESLLTATANQIYITAISNLPEIKSAENNVKSSEKAIDIAWGGLSPRLVFSAAYGTGYSGLSQRIVTPYVFQGLVPNGSLLSTGQLVYIPTFATEKIPFSEQYKDNVNKSFGFILTVPIFNRLQTKTAIDKAKIQKINADLSVESAKLQVQKSIQQAYADANGGLKKYNASLKAVDATAESFKYTEQKFNVGLVNTISYNDAKNKLTKAQNDLLQAKYEYVFKIKVLDFYQGKPLKF